MDFSLWDAWKERSWWLVGGEGCLLPLCSPDKHPSGMLLPGAGKKHHHHSFPDKFFSGI